MATYPMKIVLENRLWFYEPIAICFDFLVLIIKPTLIEIQDILSVYKEDAQNNFHKSVCLFRKPLHCVNVCCWFKLKIVN